MSSPDEVLKRAYELVDARVKASDDLTHDVFIAVESQMIEEGYDKDLVNQALDAIASDGACDTF
jgi:hypothetical protein